MIRYIVLVIWFTVVGFSQIGLAQPDAPLVKNPDGTTEFSSSVQGHFTPADSLFYAGNFKSALSEYLKLLRVADMFEIPIPFRVKRNISVCLFETKQYALAIKLFVQLLEQDGYHEFYLLMIGRALNELKRYELAVKTLKRAVLNKTGSEDYQFALFELAKAYYMLGKLDRSQEVMDSLLEITERKSYFQKRYQELSLEADIPQKSFKEKQWSPNESATKKKKEEVVNKGSVWDVLYLSSAGRFTLDTLSQVSASSESYDTKTIGMTDLIFSPMVGIGVGPWQWAFLFSRIELNSYSQHYTDVTNIKKIGSANPFSKDRWYVGHELMVDQHVHWVGWRLGYHLLADVNFVQNIYTKKGMDTSTRQLIPYVSFTYFEHFRSRFFFTYEFKPNFGDTLNTSLYKKYHISQDIQFPDEHINLYFEGLYGKLLYNSTLYDRNQMGGTVAMDVQFASWITSRLILGFNQDTYYDLRLRLPKYEDIIDIDPAGDGDLENPDKKLWTQELELKTNQYNAELSLRFNLLGVHLVMINGFWNMVQSSQKMVSDSSYSEYGFSTEYCFSFPTTEKIRSRHRYNGVYGLF